MRYTGRTNNNSKVAETVPPITTVASGRCTSAPVPVNSTAAPDLRRFSIYTKYSLESLTHGGVVKPLMMEQTRVFAHSLMTPNLGNLGLQFLEKPLSVAAQQRLSLGETGT